ncbi:heat shock 70 kDa protein 12A-like [Pholidichthys leucotaenia]
MGDSYIIAIDFGTAYSGYAYTISPKEEQLDPIVKLWGKDEGLETPKTPTCILFNEHEEFLKFGYEAIRAYTGMHEKDAKKHYLFKNFKMALYGKDLSGDVTIEDANKKSMKALTVFAEALRFLKDDALETISAKAGKEFIASDFTWVLTVPAIWDPSAKQFMRKAATQAGIVTREMEDRLVIALEPEAASVWCKKLPPNGFITKSHDGAALDQQPGTRYIVADCGGGTIDITVHEILDGGSLKELHKASGNDLGGQNVDRKFKAFLSEIFCDGIWEEYEANYPSEVQKMMYDFMYLKQVDDDVQLVCPYNLGKIAQKRKDVEELFEAVSDASWRDGSIVISRGKLTSFFNDSLSGITKILKEILDKDLGIEFILLVGGFAKSKILRQGIKEEFSGVSRILCPSKPQQAIVNGAVQYGRTPELVASRKSAFTYGIAVIELFDESRHREDKKFIADGEELCSDIFMKLVEEGEDVRWNEIRDHMFTSVERDQAGADFKFYRTERKVLIYIDEWGVDEVASFHVNFPSSSGDEKRMLKLEVKFGSTEITATGTDLESGSKEHVKIDFLVRD